MHRCCARSTGAKSSVSIDGLLKSSVFITRPQTNNPKNLTGKSTSVCSVANKSWFVVSPARVQAIGTVLHPGQALVAHRKSDVVQSNHYKFVPHPLKTATSGWRALPSSLAFGTVHNLSIATGGLPIKGWLCAVGGLRWFHYRLCVKAPIAESVLCSRLSSGRAL
jgi:hypothetical protein